jgi:outer membrane protein
MKTLSGAWAPLMYITQLRPQPPRSQHWLRRRRSLALAPVAIAGMVIGLASSHATAQDRLPQELPPGEARPITLAEAIRLARQNSPQTVQARGNERASAASVRSAYGAFLPNISLSAGSARQYGRRINPADTLGRGGQGLWTYSSGFSISTSLFDGRRFGNLQAAKADVLAAEANTLAQDYAVAVNVAQQYYSVLSARESEEAARAQLQQAEQQLVAATRRFQAGAATRSDSLRAFVNVASARTALLTAQTSLRSANATLSRLVGATDVVTATLADSAVSIPSEPIDSAILVALALEGPTIRQARATLTAADAQKSAARSAYLPTISASYSRSGSGADRRFGLGSDPYTYGGQLSFSISYPLFNQFSREEQITRAKVSLTTATASLRDAELAARQQAVQSADALRTALARIATQQAALAAAEEDLRVQQARYELGMSTIVDVLTSQTQLNQARADLISARYDARIARVQIEALIGRDLDDVLTSSPSTSNTQGTTR